jgi:hypothetical protein
LYKFEITTTTTTTATAATTTHRFIPRPGNHQIFLGNKLHAPTMKTSKSKITSLTTIAREARKRKEKKRKTNNANILKILSKKQEEQLTEWITPYHIKDIEGPVPNRCIVLANCLGCCCSLSHIPHLHGVVTTSRKHGQVIL